MGLRNHPTKSTRTRAGIATLTLSTALITVLTGCGSSSDSSSEPSGEGQQPIIPVGAYDEATASVALPELEGPIEVTADSHPFNGAAWSYTRGSI